MRKRIFEIIDVSNGEDKFSRIYDCTMIIVIGLSLLPLAFKQTGTILNIIDKSTVTIFIIDYLLRLITADYKYGEGALSFVRYPFSVMAIIDLISILPSFTFFNTSFKLLRIIRMARAMRTFRILKIIRYSKSFAILTKVLKTSKDSLIAVCTLAVAYIIISALVIFNVEPNTFNNFFDAIYWATVSLTTVGYGDIYPVSTVGRVVTMISSVFGIAIVALPAGIITAGYMSFIDKSDKTYSDREDV